MPTFSANNLDFLGQPRLLVVLTLVREEVQFCSVKFSAQEVKSHLSTVRGKVENSATTHEMPAFFAVKVQMHNRRNEEECVKEEKRRIKSCSFFPFLSPTLSFPTFLLLPQLKPYLKFHCVLMVLFVSPRRTHLLKERLRFAKMESGGVCVMEDGTLGRQQWYAPS